MPIMLWRTMNSRSGIDVNNVVEAGETFQNTELANQQQTTLQYMTKQMDRSVVACVLSRARIGQLCCI